MAASAKTTWLVGIVSLLIIAFEVIGTPKPARSLTHPTLNVPHISQPQEVSPMGAGERRRRREAEVTAVGATGIRG